MMKKLYSENIVKRFREIHVGSEGEDDHAEDGYFYDEDEDIDLEFDDDDVYYDGENIDRFLENGS